MSESLLVAGVGNIFFGDDGFGVEVVRRLAQRPQPDGVEIHDFGIRGFDLAYALERFETVLFCDAMSRGESPGTLFLVEPAPEDVYRRLPGVADPHGMTVDAVLKWQGIESLPKRMRLLGCEPESFGPPEEGQLGLSETVGSRVEVAVEMAEQTIVDLVLKGEKNGA